MITTQMINTIITTQMIKINIIMINTIAAVIRVIVINDY